MTIIIRNPLRPSEGAKLLAQALGCKRMLGTKQALGKSITYCNNWGNSTPLATSSYRTSIINPPREVELSSNKLLTFLALQSRLQVPRFWTSVAEVDEDVSRLYTRTLLRASGGRGIGSGVER
jgi:hypothetical protein